MTEIICAMIAAAASVLCAYAAAAAKRREKSERERAALERQRDEKLAALIESQKIILLDRIRHLGQRYLAEKAIDFDDRRLLHSMHDSYHNGLGGNGDADVIMREIDALPLRT